MSSSDAPNNGENLEDRLERQHREIQALTDQVVADFEELSLLRSLTTAIPSLESEDATARLVDHFLSSLIAGLGAESIVAVLANSGLNQPECDPNNPSLKRWVRDARWVGPRLCDDKTISELVIHESALARKQPVIRNDGKHQDCVSLTSAVPTIREYILLECRCDHRLHGWLIAFNRVDHDEGAGPWVQHGFTTSQANLLQIATSQLSTQLQNVRLFEQKEELFTEVVQALVFAVEAKDSYTCGHSERVAHYSRHLGRLYGLSPKQCKQLYLTGLIHDVGKIGIPDEVLKKPGKLDPDERLIAQSHAHAGWRILHGLEALHELLPGVRHHHERYDGAGYPDGLSGGDIPLAGRILAVCDGFDAMTSDRPYRAGMTAGDACEILSNGSGSHWDPALVELFVANLDQFEDLRFSHDKRALTGGFSIDVTKTMDNEFSQNK